MGETVGDVLRSLREAAGLSLDALAARVYCHKSEVGYVETGKRRVTPAFAARCDKALGTTPLLTVLLELEDKGDNVKRRTLIANLSAATGLSGIGGAAALAEVVRHGLLDATGEPEDWDTVVAEYSRRLVTDPSQQYGYSLQAQLMIARQQIIDEGKTPDRLRAYAELGQLYGLWLGNGGDVASARGWYRTATALADRSTHTPTRVFTRARSASRGIYEGYTVRETVDGANEALSLSKAPTPGAVEAYSALVHVHALTDNLNAGRRALGKMRDTAEQLPDQIAGPVQRTISFANFLECRIGPFKAATAAHEEALAAFRPLPVWLAESKVYYGRALVNAGDLTGGIDYGLGAVKTLPHAVRTINMAVSDLLSVVPAGYRSDAKDELAQYAAAGPGPWETIA